MKKNTAMLEDKNAAVTGTAAAVENGDCYETTQNVNASVSVSDAGVGSRNEDDYSSDDKYNDDHFSSDDYNDPFDNEVD